MDETTINHYNKTAEETCQRYRQASMTNLRCWIDSYLSSPVSVLDVACGSGRDLALFASLGHIVKGVDASAAMIEQALIHFPELEGKLLVDSLPDLSSLKSRSFEVVTALAVLMHIPEDEIFSSLSRLSSLVACGGLLLIALPADRRTEPGKNRIEDGRFFNSLTPETIKKQLQSSKLELIEQFAWPDSLGRTKLKWHGLTFRKFP